MAKLTLLDFPDTKDHLTRNRIELALKALNNPDMEYELVDEVLVALYNYFETLEGSDMILNDLNKMRGACEGFYGDD
jgi:hypothetical protein